MIEAAANSALDQTTGLADDENRVLSETIGDIRAMAHLCNYCAAKSRGATNLGLYRASKEGKYKTAAIANLEQALANWKENVGILDAQYIMMNIAMQRVLDWHKIETEVREDIEITRNAE